MHLRCFSQRREKIRRRRPRSHTTSCGPTHLSHRGGSEDAACDSVSRRCANVCDPFFFKKKMHFLSKCFQSSDGSLQSLRRDFLVLSHRCANANCLCFLYLSGASDARSHLTSFKVSSRSLISISISLPLLLPVFHLSHFLVSQADDDSSQTPPDDTVRPKIKIHNIGE